MPRSTGDTWTHLDVAMEIEWQKTDTREIVDHGDRENEGMMLDREIVVHDRRAIVVHDHRNDLGQESTLTGSNGRDFSREFLFES